MPESETNAVAIARVEERVAALGNHVEGIERDLALQGTDVSAMRADLKGFMAEVRAHIKAEESATKTREKTDSAHWESHEQRHDRDTTRVYMVLGIVGGGVAALATLLAHWIR